VTIVFFSRLDLFKQEDKEDSDNEVSFRILSPEKQMMNKSSGIEVPDEETILMLDMVKRHFLSKTKKNNSVTRFMVWANYKQPCRVYSIKRTECLSRFV
jgi:hypothetical protein